MEPSIAERAISAVREQATARGISQQEIANLLQLHKSQITRRMNGDIEFSLTELGVLAAAWDIPLSRLLPDQVTEGAT